MAPRRKRIVPVREPSQDSSERSDFDEESYGTSSESSQEVTLNILERERRITAGRDEELDNAFWGSEQHRTWEESESDADVSFDLNEEDEDENESESELDDEDDEDEEEDEEEEEDDEEIRRKRPRFQAYKVPHSQDVMRKKTVIKRKLSKQIATPKSLADSEATERERRETRGSTRARTMEVEQRASVSSLKKKIISPSATPRHRPTQEQLIEEAKIVEEWNKADYDAYLRYTELSEKERNALIQKRRTKGPKNMYTIVSRSFIANNHVCSEIKIVPPVIDEPSQTKKREKTTSANQAQLRSVSDVLGIIKRVPIPSSPKKIYKYRCPYGSKQGFNTIEEFAKIRDREQAAEMKQATKLIAQLDSLLAK